MKARFVAYTAMGTDGTDITKVGRIFEVVDDEGFTSTVIVPPGGNMEEKIKSEQDEKPFPIAIDYVKPQK